MGCFRRLQQTHAKNLSIRQLANLSKVSHSYLSQIESGERGTPSPEVLSKLARPLGTPYEELMRAAGYIEEVIDHGGFSEHVFAMMAATWSIVYVVLRKWKPLIVNGLIPLIEWPKSLP